MCVCVCVCVCVYIFIGRLWHTWEDNIKMDLQDVGCGGVDWTELAQDRDRWQEIVNAEMNFRVPLNKRHLTS